MFNFLKRKKPKYKVDTSKEGYERIGIPLTDEEYNDICNINVLMAGEILGKGQGIPAHYVILILKALGVLPVKNRDDEPVNIVAEQTEEVWDKEFQKKFGIIKKT